MSHQKCNYRLSLRGGSACSSSFSSRNLQHRNTTVAMLRRALQRASTKRLIQDTVLYQTILNIAGTHIAYSVLSHLGFHKLLSFKKHITTKRHRFSTCRLHSPMGWHPSTHLITPSRMKAAVQEEANYQAIGSYWGTHGCINCFCHRTSHTLPTQELHFVHLKCDRTTWCQNAASSLQALGISMHEPMCPGHWLT